MKKTGKAIGYVCDIPIPGAGELISKEEQRIRILKHVEKEALELVSIYEDEKHTEDFINRPGVQNVLNCKEDFEVLLVERVWCLSRRMKDLLPFLEKLDSMDVQLVCTSYLWDYASQKVRRRYTEDLGERMRKEAKARAATVRGKRQAA